MFEANYRFADNAFDEEKAIYHRNITIDGKIRSVISAEVRENTDNDFTAVIYLYVRPDTGENNGDIPEQRIPILTKEFDDRDKAKKFLERMRGTF